MSSVPSGAVTAAARTCSLLVIYTNGGANDDCAGASTDLEALGTLRDLIESGALPRPKRTIRMWLGFEIYGSMAYTVHNLDRLREKTLAVLCCDSPAENYDHATTALTISSNFNACPSFTDALFPEVVGRYYDNFAPDQALEADRFHVRAGQLLRRSHDRRSPSTPCTWPRALTIITIQRTPSTKSTRDAQGGVDPPRRLSVYPCERRCR